MDTKKIAIENIESIEIFPDYCSTGVWVTTKGDISHRSCLLDELPFKFKDGIVKKINLMNACYDTFGYVYEGKKSKTDDNSFDFMVYEIIEDIRREHPEISDLIKIRDFQIHMWSDNSNHDNMNDIQDIKVGMTR